jgi:transcriptional regulator with XRE-family HTH domain
MIELEQLEAAVAEGLSTWKLAERFNTVQSNIRRQLEKHGLETKRRDTKFCKECGVKIASRYQFCGNICHKTFVWKNWLRRWLCGETRPVEETANRIRRALRELRGDKCERCGWCEVHPKTELVPVELEHKDGNFRNNKPDNVCLLCPNCHSLTLTFRGLNRGKGRTMQKRLENRAI